MSEIDEEESLIKPNPPKISIKNLEKKLKIVKTARIESKFNMAAFDMEEVDRWRQIASKLIFEAQVQNIDLLENALNALDLAFDPIRSSCGDLYKKFEATMDMATYAAGNYRKTKKSSDYILAYGYCKKLYRLFNQIKALINLSIPTQKESGAMRDLEEAML